MLDAGRIKRRKIWITNTTKISLIIYLYVSLDILRLIEIASFRVLRVSRCRIYLSSNWFWLDLLCQWFFIFFMVLWKTSRVWLFNTPVITPLALSSFMGDSGLMKLRDLQKVKISEISDKLFNSARNTKSVWNKAQNMKLSHNFLL